jgi:twinkle protein
MKIKSLTSGNIYEVVVNKAGENTQPCPECSHNRRKHKDKCFSFHAEKGAGYCVHCGTKFVEYKPFITEKQYKRPEWKNKTELTNKAMAYIQSRSISQETINTMKIHSDIIFMPQHGKDVDVICFPYFLNGDLVNVKYRGPLKSFMLYKDAELVLYNIDCVSAYDEIIFVEGEIDALTLISAGISNVVSVPNGASKNLSYLDDYIHLFDNKRIIVAVDNDSPGYELRQELIRRFGPENCSTINWKTCKDANEYLQLYGREELASLIINAEPVPMPDIVNYDDQYNAIYELYMHGLQPGKKINDEIDELITWELGRMAVWTGIPSHGKSEVCDWLNCRLNIIHGWKMAYFSPENYPIQYHYAKIAEKLSGKKFNAAFMDRDEFEFLYNYVKENVYIIYPEEDFSINSILAKAKYLVKRHGISTLTIDPYNRLENRRDKGESETDYISRFLDTLQNFGVKNNVLINLVAHPRKMDKGNNNQFTVPDLYSINGSANFYNKCDYGIVVHRYRDLDPHTELHFLKVKFRHLGDGGTVKKKFNYNNGRYEPYTYSVNMWDNNSWIRQASDTTPEVILPDLITTREAQF